MPNRFWVRNEVRRRNPDNTVSIYCATCGREIMRAAQSQIGSVNKCALCVLKAQGVVNAEDYILPQYKIPSTGFPIPLDYDDSLAAGILMLNPEEKLDPNQPIPQVGGIVGTVRSVFRVIGFAISKPVEVIKSVQLASEKRTGLFGPNKERR